MPTPRWARRLKTSSWGISSNEDMSGSTLEKLVQSLGSMTGNLDLFGGDTFKLAGGGAANAGVRVLGLPFVAT